MGVVEIVVIILLLKVPIIGLMWLVWWAGHPAETSEGPSEEKYRDYLPRRLEPSPPRGPRRRGPHGGAAARPPAPHTDGGRNRPASAPRPRRIPQTTRASD